MSVAVDRNDIDQGLEEPAGMPRWHVGLCAFCLAPLDPWAVGRANAAFCSKFCRRRAADVRYDRRAIRDDRIVEALQCGDMMTAQVIYDNHLIFYALDMAYVRPRVTGELRAEVLQANDGLCVACNHAPATEVDHIRGDSIERDNLQGLCRDCHEAKPRGPIPADLTRNGDGAVDETDYTDLVGAWRRALTSQELFRSDALTPAWQDLYVQAEQDADTRFGQITLQILSDDVDVPALREDWEQAHWAYAHATRSWAARLTGQPAPAPTRCRYTLDDAGLRLQPRPEPPAARFEVKASGAEIRAWAREHGHRVASNGTLPRAVVSAYEAAHSR